MICTVLRAPTVALLATNALACVSLLELRSIDNPGFAAMIVPRMPGRTIYSVQLEVLEIIHRDGNLTTVVPEQLEL